MTAVEPPNADTATITTSDCLGSLRTRGLPEIDHPDMAQSGTVGPR